MKEIENQPADMKKGILNFPDITTERSNCIVGPSNGSAPHTNTYKTTPRLCNNFDRPNANFYRTIVPRNSHGFFLSRKHPMEDMEGTVDGAAGGKNPNIPNLFRSSELLIEE